MSIQLPRSPITPTGNDDMVENLPCDAQSNDTELSRDLEVLKHDCDWKSLRDRLYSDTVSSLPLLPPTPTGFTQTPRRLFVYRVLAANAAKERAIEERDEYYEAKACLAQRIVSMHDQLYNEARIGRDQIDQITDLRIRNQDLQDTTTSLSQEKETLGQEILASNGKEALIQDLTYRNKVLQDVNTSLARENATIHDRCSQETSISQSLSKRNKIQAQAASRYCRELFLTRNNIWVVVRIRNPIPSDEAKPVLGFSLDPVNMKLGILSNDDTTWLAEAESIHEQLGIVSVGSPIQPAQARTESGSFTFDSVLLPPTSNIQVCIEIEPTIQAFLDGHDMCIIADGQSGSGKSYTMLNGDHSIADWAARFTFEWMELAERPHRECAAKCSILEIYKNRTRDLLADNDPPGQKTIEIRRSGPDPISCESYHPLRSADDVSKLRRKACAQRVNRSTDQNQSSSRSDLILIITLTQFDVATKTSATSSLFLVDLAGSEVWPDSSPHDEEIKAIKQSRECLKQAMIKYQASTEPIPGNQLTLLLRRCFQPPSKIVLLATASPLQQDQKATQATLNFASHIRNSKTQPPKTKKTAKEKK